MTTTPEPISVSFTGLAARGRIPRWAKPFDAKRCTVTELSNADCLPAFIVLNAGTPEELGQYRFWVNNIAHRLQNTDTSWRLIVSYASKAAPKKDKPWEYALETLRFFPGSSSQIEISIGKEHLQQTFYEAIAKWLAEIEEQKDAVNRKSKTDPLAEAKEVIKATRPLLAPSGRLSASAIANAFGISIAKLAESMGRLRQTVSKTPDSPKIQSDLKPFERIARLRAVLSEKDFKTWLGRPNRELDQKAPIELILRGESEIVADLAEDMLLGSPS